MVRKKRKLSNLDWIDKHLDINTLLVDDLRKISDISYEVKEKTPLKLISIGYITNLYTSIIQKHFNKWMYLDLLAGCGLNIVNNQDHIPGSPFIALEASKKFPFQNMIFIEINEQYSTILSQRIEYLEKNHQDYDFLGSSESARCNYSVLNDDITNFCQNTSFFEELNDYRTHALIVIDPEGFEISWDNLSKFLECRCDIIFNFMTGYIAREWGVAISEKAKNRHNAIRNMEKLFGDHSWEDAKNATELLQIFITKIESDYEKIIIPINIRGSRKSEFYDLLFITNPTKGNNPWLGSIQTLKNRIERAGGRMVQDSLDYLKGRRERLDVFLME